MYSSQVLGLYNSHKTIGLRKTRENFAAGAKRRDAPPPHSSSIAIAEQIIAHDSEIMEFYQRIALKLWS